MVQTIKEVKEVDKEVDIHIHELELEITIARIISGMIKETIIKMEIRIITNLI